MDFKDMSLTPFNNPFQNTKRIYLEWKQPKY